MMKFLIVDFNDDFFPIYERKFSIYNNVELKLVRNLDEAIYYLDQYKPDCIMLNHTFGKAVKYYDILRKCNYVGKIIILASGKEKAIKRSMYNGIAGILDKSLNGEDFRSNLDKILQSDRLCA